MWGAKSSRWGQGQWAATKALSQWHRPSYHVQFCCFSLTRKRGKEDVPRESCTVAAGHHGVTLAGAPLVASGCTAAWLPTTTTTRHWLLQATAGTSTQRFSTACFFFLTDHGGATRWHLQWPAMTGSARWSSTSLLRTGSNNCTRGIQYSFRTCYMWPIQNLMDNYFSFTYVLVSAGTLPILPKLAVQCSGLSGSTPLDVCHSA